MLEKVIAWTTDSAHVPRHRTVSFTSPDSADNGPALPEEGDATHGGAEARSHESTPRPARAARPPSDRHNAESSIVQPHTDPDAGCSPTVGGSIHIGPEVDRSREERVPS